MVGFWDVGWLVVWLVVHSAGVCLRFSMYCDLRSSLVFRGAKGTEAGLSGSFSWCHHPLDTTLKFRNPLKSPGLRWSPRSQAAMGSK